MTEFRKMRRARQELGHDACVEMIERATSGVLSVLGDGGYPYGVPMSYVFHEDEKGARFFFHSAKTGHKIDALRSCDKACFTVVDMDDVVADEFTTYFRSVVCFGRVKILESPEEIVPAMRILADRYSPDEADEKKENEITKQLPALAVIELDVEHMTGKEAIELVRKRAKYE